MHLPATSKTVQARLSMARPRLLTCSTFARRTLILVRGTGRPPTLRIANNCKWHLFLSHTWAHGQDQAHKIKAGLGTSVNKEGRRLSRLEGGLYTVASAEYRL